MTTPRPLALTTDPIAQLTWRIAIPASVGMFFNTLFNFVDTPREALQMLQDMLGSERRPETPSLARSKTPDTTRPLP